MQGAPRGQTDFAEAAEDLRRSSVSVSGDRRIGRRLGLRRVASMSAVGDVFARIADIRIHPLTQM